MGRWSIRPQDQTEIGLITRIVIQVIWGIVYAILTSINQYNRFGDMKKVYVYPCAVRWFGYTT